MSARREFFVHNLGLHEEGQEAVPPGFSPSLLNVDLNTDGRVTLPRLGISQFTSEAMPSPLRGLWKLRRPDGTWATCAASGNKLYRVKATGEPVLVGDLHGPAHVQRSGQVFGGRLFICSGYGPPQVYQTELEDLDDLEDVSLPSSWEDGNWPSRVTLVNAGANERLVMWGLRKDPTRAYFSVLQDYLDWTGAGSFSIAVAEDDGEPLIAVGSFHSLLACIKRTKGVVYTGVTGDGPQGMQIVPYGCYSQESLVNVGDDLVWHGDRGVIALSAALEPGAAARGNVLSKRIKGSIGQVPPPQGKSSFAVWDERLRRVRIFGASRTSLDNDLHWDYYPFHALPGQPGAWVPGSGIAASCAATYRTASGPQILLGGYDGHLYLMNDTYQDNGVAIPAHYSLPKIRLPRRGAIRVLDWMIHEGGENLVVDAAIDGGTAERLPNTLAPHFSGEAAPTRARQIHYGIGHEFAFTLRHSGGASPGVLDGLFAEVEIFGGR